MRALLDCARYARSGRGCILRLLCTPCLAFARAALSGCSHAAMVRRGGDRSPWLLRHSFSTPSACVRVRACVAYARHNPLGMAPRTDRVASASARTLVCCRALLCAVAARLERESCETPGLAQRRAEVLCCVLKHCGCVTACTWCASSVIHVRCYAYVLGVELVCCHRRGSTSDSCRTGGRTEVCVRKNARRSAIRKASAVCMRLQLGNSVDSGRTDSSSTSGRAVGVATGAERLAARPPSASARRGAAAAQRAAARFLGACCSLSCRLARAKSRSLTHG